MRRSLGIVDPEVEDINAQVADAGFPCTDAYRYTDQATGIEMTDTTRPPGTDESALLTGLLTAVARPSVPTAPAFLLTAPPRSGAGSGKGKLVRAIAAIAFGVPPRAFTSSRVDGELEKRLATALLGGDPCLLLDNLNDTGLTSDLLASAITEETTTIRVFGRNDRSPTIRSTAFMAITGNGAAVEEDLLRRFIHCHLDARMESPESRPFTPGFPRRRGRPPP